jgi:hypothetical protein
VVFDSLKWAAIIAVQLKRMVELGLGGVVHQYCRLTTD